MESIDIEEIDCDTCLIMQEILRDEIEDEEFLEFAIDNFCELLSYIATDNLNIRIHKDSQKTRRVNRPDSLFGGPARRAVWQVSCDMCI